MLLINIIDNKLMDAQWKVPNEADAFFDALNSYHSNIKFTPEQNPKKFLHTQITVAD